MHQSEQWAHHSLSVQEEPERVQAALGDGNGDGDRAGDGIYVDGVF